MGFLSMLGFGKKDEPQIICFFEQIEEIRDLLAVLLKDMNENYGEKFGKGEFVDDYIAKLNLLIAKTGRRNLETDYENGTQIISLQHHGLKTVLSFLQELKNINNETAIANRLRGKEVRDLGNKIKDLNKIINLKGTGKDYNRDHWTHCIKNNRSEIYFRTLQRRGRI